MITGIAIRQCVLIEFLLRGDCRVHSKLLLGISEGNVAYRPEDVALGRFYQMGRQLSGGEDMGWVHLAQGGV